MITLKLIGKHCPNHYIGRYGGDEKKRSDGLYIYEINPDALTDIFDELCERIIKLSDSNRKSDNLIYYYKKLLNKDEQPGSVCVGGGCGD